jgi:hypothetical protein
VFRVGDFAITVVVPAGTIAETTYGGTGGGGTTGAAKAGAAKAGAAKAGAAKAGAAKAGAAKAGAAKAGAAEERLQDRGQGPIELALTVADLGGTRAALAAGGAHPEPVPDDPAALLVTQDQILGARLIFRQRTG